MALADAKKKLSFLLVYLHSHRHQDTDEFCRSVLSNRKVINFIDSEMLFWACNVDSGEGYKVSLAMRETAYPFLALICLRGRKMMIVLRQQGLCTPWMLIDVLRTAMHDNSVYLNVARQEKADREYNQVLRQQQEAAYLECLYADQLKETQRLEEQRQKEAEDAAVKKEEDRKRFEAEQLKKQKSDLRNSLPPEPQPNRLDSLRISLKFPNDTRFERRFLLGDPVSLLRDVTFSHPNCPENYSVITVYPRKVLFSRNDHLTESTTLKDIGIDGSVSLIVHNNDA
ncbi:unnamed protein product [Soboliphyme baturini]|uniref:UBX domain-containing protein n=1 Tax=Soboliphyme baturini TaxID=241478 RepID=A0A183J1W9_9BILA|nr:unnamed protein product [Soboliphyme baturini]